MKFRFSISLAVATALLLNVGFVKANGPVYTRPNVAKKKDADFELQGEYAGEIDVESGLKVGAQVVAMGKGKFAATIYHGGLPGDGWGGEREVIEAAKKDDGSVTFVGESGEGILKDGALTVVVNGDEVGTMKKVKRKSKTLGKKPPEGAVVLFNGKDTDGFDNAEMDRKMLTFKPKSGGTTSKNKFGSHSLHIEFRLPYMPEARGQDRGNSGIYLQGRYEVQMLDSFGHEGADNECGGVYQIAKPKENMCYPPLTWQTYDIDFTAAEYDNAGKIHKNPKMTVKHNGVVIHKDLELPKDTTASPIKAGPEDGPVYLQDHGTPVRYRNIWVVNK
jgi:hypothetical protein